jgi:four helix bundle protein
MEVFVSDIIGSFEDLKCWQAGRDFRLFVAKEVMPILPREERFRLGDQVLRSARSITANIAEGYGRFHYLDNSKFCSMARGSCEGLLSAETLLIGREKFEHTKRLLNGYMRYLKRSANPPNP